jgi:hypothetical protein
LWLTGSCSNSPKLDPKDGIHHDKSLEELGVTYGRFGDGFDELFRSGNHNVTQTAQQYLCGLMQAEKRNMERMASGKAVGIFAGAARHTRRFRPDGKWRN